ncbi:MAG TPA: trp RNA-binding attenuation protein MtrB, partial [Firmicutes bacterium]|nr:trp RNA-binding attenuation protein MtrB [Bacillota bacterium]
MRPADVTERTSPVEEILGDYVVVRALEDGVTIIGLTRGRET